MISAKEEKSLKIPAHHLKQQFGVNFWENNFLLIEAKLSLKMTTIHNAEKKSRSSKVSKNNRNW